MKKPVVLLATAVGALALAAAIGVGVATAGPTAAATPTAAPSASSTPQAGPTPAGEPSAGTTKKHRDLTRRALHGEVTLGGAKHRVVDFQRGTVSAVSDSSVTVRSADGFVGTYVVGPKTKVRVATTHAAIGDIATGDRVRVVAVKTGKTLTATRLVERKR